jgi:hypothetical protein
MVLIGAKTIDLKGIVNEALEKCTCVETVFGSKKNQFQTSA